MSNDVLPTVMRWKPNFRYLKNKTDEFPLSNFLSLDDSVTDKESYIDLGNNSTGGTGQTPSYSIPAGEDYDPNNDFSYLNRPDITIVDLDNYIEDFKKRLESADDALRAKIEKELSELQEKRDNLADNLDNVEQQKTE